MGLPKKALRESQLKKLTAGSAGNDGSHVILQVTFIEDGIEKPAFFKTLAPKKHYPELLAKMSVAASLFKRLFQGKKSAEERLVFDKNDKLIGSLSLAIEGFKPFNYANEAIPIDPNAREQVIPSTKTLIKKNINEVLFGRWFLDDDDGHPHNLGFAGDDSADIDFDMFWYWFTIWMKEPRTGIGVPKKRVLLTVRDWESFPNVKDSKPYHCAPYKSPGQETIPMVLPGTMQGAILNKILPKVYADPTQFEQLAAEPEAHEQKFASAMKALLVYNPEMVRNHLTDLFGDLTFNYTSLDDTDIKLRLKYEEEFPELCNKDTNTISFVDFMMNMYQKHYDSLYRVVVFHMGCDNNGYGVSLPATCAALYNKPSYYQEIVKWAKRQNETLYNKEPQSHKYNLVELQKRYHQVWRDAYGPIVNELLDDAYSLTNKLLLQVSNSPAALTEIKGKKVTDDSLTNSWELFTTIPDLSVQKIEPLIDVDKESKLREGLLLLVQFTCEFREIIRSYYNDKACADLTEEDNLEFSDKLSQLYTNYNLKIRQSLAHTSSQASEFNLIAARLKQVTEQVNFQLHLTTTDEQMTDAINTTATKELLPHTHETVMRQFNDFLFLWAKNIKPEELSILIKDIIDTHYAPVLSGLSNRHRAKPVKEYLADSMTDSGDNRLAYILSSGNEETGALNTLLIQHLTPLMLQVYPLLSIRNAVKDGSFNRDIAVFTKSAVNFAKCDSRFVHLYSNKGMELFYKTMYEWIDFLPVRTFNKIIKEALEQYESGLSYLHGWFGGKGSRRLEVEGYCKNSAQSKAVAMTFLKGVETSSLNGQLFHTIIDAMKLDISKSVEKQKTPGYKLISQYRIEEHKTHLFEGLKSYAVEPSHKQVVKSIKFYEEKKTSSMVV